MDPFDLVAQRHAAQGVETLARKYQGESNDRCVWTNSRRADALMPRRIWIPLGFTVVASACATQPQEVPQQITPVVTRFTYANGTAQYAYTSQRTIDQEVAGQTTRTETVLRLLLSTTIDDTGAGRAVRFTVDSILDVAGPGITQASRRAITGLSLDATLQPTGEISEFSENSERSPLMATVTSAMKQFFPRIPVDGPEPGSEWVDTTVVVTNDGSTRITKSSVVYSTAGDWLDNSGAMPVSWRSEYTLEGEGQQMGQNFSLSGSGLTHGEHMLSADGFYMSTSSRDSSNAEVNLPAFGITVPIVQMGVDSVRMVR